MRRILFLIGSLLAVSTATFGSPAFAGKSHHHKSPIEFGSLEMRLENNFTDGDAEVVFLAKTDEGGLKSFAIRNPLGEKIFKSRSRDSGDVGIREYALETAEPSVQGVLDAYPEGTYSMKGKLFDGTPVKGSLELSHALLPPPGFSPNGDVVDASQPISVFWDGVGAEFYIVEIENDDLQYSFMTRVSGSTTEITIAPGMLEDGTEYEISIGSVTDTGNIRFVEGSFETQ